ARTCSPGAGRTGDDEGGSAADAVAAGEAGRPRARRPRDRQLHRPFEDERAAAVAVDPLAHERMASVVVPRGGVDDDTAAATEEIGNAAQRAADRKRDRHATPTDERRDPLEAPRDP